MRKILQINVTVNSGSHGRIAEELGIISLEENYFNYIAAAYTNNPSRNVVIKIGNGFDRKLHVLKTRLFDWHGFGSTLVTRKLVHEIGSIDPDIIHLHNIHGYFLNARVLFEYLKKAAKPVIWTLHDCWPFTGHCSHFERIKCEKWQTECYECPNKRGYPASWFFDNSRNNFREKKELFCSLDNMVIVSPSEWLSRHLKKSFLSKYSINVIRNGVDTEIFKPASSNETCRTIRIPFKYILGVASNWNECKGLNDFFKLRELVSPDLKLVLIGLSKSQIRSLPRGIIGITRTENTNELAELYSAAEVLVNPTYVDNFPSVNLEALACGTPVITYKTGGCPESIDENTGIVIEKGDITGLNYAISIIINSKFRFTKEQCRTRAQIHFSSKKRFNDYLKLYKNSMSGY